jgi:hypothetical protein
MAFPADNHYQDYMRDMAEDRALRRGMLARERAIYGPPGEPPDLEG